MIKFSAPGKIHLLGEHAVVYGRPALLAAIDLRVTVSITPSLTVIASDPELAEGERGNLDLKNIIEPIIRKHLKLKTIPLYQLKIDSQIPAGSGMGSSAAVSAAYLGALITFLGYPWDVKLINELTFEAEKVFHGNPSGADNTVVVYGGLLWYRKETEPVKLFSQIKQFMLIDSGRPVESTKEMVEKVSVKCKVQSAKCQKIFDDQERLVKGLAQALKNGNQNKMMDIIKAGERNLEKLGVVGKKAQNIIRLVEKTGGAAKIMGGGGVKSGSGMLLSYHKNPQALLALGRKHHLPTWSITLAEAGLLQESSAP